MNLFLNIIGLVAPGVVFFCLLHYGAPSFVTIAYFVASALFALVEGIGIWKRRRISEPVSSNQPELIGSA